MGTETASPDRARRTRRLLHALRARGSATLAELAKDAGISRPTASLIVSNLEAMGLVAQSAVSMGAGRPAALYSFTAAHGFVIALDIQRDAVSLAAASIAGTVLHTEVVELVERDREERLVELGQHITDLTDSLTPLHGRPVCGFAATTGIVDGDGVILRSYSVPQWQALPLAQRLTELTGLPFRVDNDINCAAYGEFATRATKGRIGMSDTMLHIRLFAGFRTGLILGGDIHRGHHWHAGEVNDTLDGELRARLDAETEPVNWPLRAAYTIGTVASAIDPTLVVISTTDLLDATAVDEVWGHLKAMRLPTAPRLEMEQAELEGAASTIGALSLALRDAESHFLGATTPHPVSVNGLEQVIAAHRNHTARRKAEPHRHAVVVSEPLRVGVVGLRPDMRLARHAESEQNRAVIVGACDPEPTATTQVQQLLGRQPESLPVFTSVRELIESGLGAAFVSGDMYETAAPELLEAGIPVHLADPLVGSIDGCTRTLEAARSSGTRLYAGQVARHTPRIRQLRELILAGAIGEVQAVSCRHLGERALTSDFDAIHWLVGSETTEVTAMGSLPEGAVMTTMRLRSGVMACHQRFRLLPEEWSGWSIIGSAGRLENFRDGAGEGIRLWRHHDDAAEAEQFPIPEDDDAEGACVAEFLRHVRDGAPTVTSPPGAWYANAVAIQAAESLAEGSTPRRIPTLSAELRDHF
ncbi:MAG: ROK family protein [Propionibacteriaceae bacterium]|nr:ROK family protein [Propionibacteriaceae bacterium]